MSEYITLLGAEQVQSGGYAMREAGTVVQGAAYTISEAMARHASQMQDLVYALNRHSEALEKYSATVT